VQQAIPKELCEFDRHILSLSLGFFVLGLLSRYGLGLVMQFVQLGMPYVIML